MQSIVRKGYTVCPYISNDLVLAQRLEELGVHAVMPLASPIGTGRGINNPLNLSYIIENASVPVIVDAGIGSPKDASCHGAWRRWYFTQHSHFSGKRSCENG